MKDGQITLSRRVENRSDRNAPKQTIRHARVYNKR